MNPYRIADDRQRHARRDWRGAAPMVGAVVTAMVLPDSFYAVGRDVPASVADISARVGMALAAGLALSAYSAIVRGDDRGVVDIHPLLPAAWFSARCRRLAREHLGWLLAGWILVGPLGAASPAALLGAGVVVGCAWMVGLAAGVGVNLAAPAVGLDPRWAQILDAIRGVNPRLQAALLYAPGIALTVAGGAILAAAESMRMLLNGRMLGMALLAVPLVVAGGCVALGRRHAAEVARFPLVLGEIDAAWGAVDTSEEARRAYLDWTVPRFPAGWRPHVLRELRHLWRGERGLAVLSWVAMAVVGLAALAPDGRAVEIALAGCGVVGVAGARLGRNEPRWLDDTLGLGAARVVPMRALAVGLWLQPVVFATLAGLAVRRRGEVMEAALRLEGLVVLFAVAAAGAAWWGRRRGVLFYLPAAVVVWGAGVRG